MKVYREKAPFTPDPARPGAAYKILHTDSLTIATWQFAKGWSSPRHVHPQEQTVHIIQGRAEFNTDAGAVTVGAGDKIVFAGNEGHAVKMLEDTILMDIFWPLREDFNAKFKAMTPEIV